MGHLTLQFPLALLGIFQVTVLVLWPATKMFWFISVVFQMQQSAVVSEKGWKTLNIGLTFHDWTEVLLQINTYVTLYLMGE